MIARSKSIALITQPDGTNWNDMPMPFLEFYFSDAGSNWHKDVEFYLVPGTALLRFSHSCSKLASFIMLILYYK